MPLNQVVYRSNMVCFSKLVIILDQGLQQNATVRAELSLHKRQQRVNQLTQGLQRQVTLDQKSTSRQNASTRFAVGKGGKNGKSGIRPPSVHVNTVRKPRVMRQSPEKKSQNDMKTSSRNNIGVGKLRTAKLLSLGLGNGAEAKTANALLGLSKDMPNQTHVVKKKKNLILDKETCLTKLQGMQEVLKAQKF